MEVTVTPVEYDQTLTEPTDYDIKISDLMDNYSNVKWINGLDEDKQFPCVLPYHARTGLLKVNGLTLHDNGNIVAILIAMNDKKVQDAVWEFYSKNVNLRHALFEWGKLQEERQEGV